MKSTARCRANQIAFTIAIFLLTLAAGLLFSGRAQSQQSSKPVEAQQGGVSTAGARPAVLDAENRPITAGGFVDSGPIVFQDIAEKAGLTKWRHEMGTPRRNLIIETVGSGVGLIDYDRDGWLDIYLVNGSTYDAVSGKVQPPHAALFHNNHDGTFTNVAE